MPNGSEQGQLNVCFICTYSIIELYQANVGLSNFDTAGFAGAKLFAIGDLDNDKSIDIITLSEDESAFSAHYFNQETYMFVSGPSN